ncbi:MAG TPA: FAD-dependent monooxygenase [Micromonosporaceae bacterium]
MTGPVDVLVVGAGPTGLALAAQLDALGVSVQVVDRRAAPFRESRAIVVQPRTLEVLRPLGLAERLVARGDPAPDFRLHLGTRVTRLRLGAASMPDVGYPFLLMLPQAQVEAVLLEYLVERGVPVRWGTRFDTAIERDDDMLVTLRDGNGERERVPARYLAGCDGAGSTVRAGAGIGFPERPYGAAALLADVDLDTDLASDAAHVFLGSHGVLFFLHLRENAPWRMVTIRSGSRRPDPLDAAGIADALTDGQVRVREVVWDSWVPLRRGFATAFRAGRTVLAGDAAHVHSPAAAQGMNTGIQDAANLGWKLALAAAGVPAASELLDSYEIERRPVDRATLALTHLAYLVEAGANPLVGRARSVVAPLAAPLVGFDLSRRLVVRVMGQLWLRYPPGPAVVGTPGRVGGPCPGARMPDVDLRRDGVSLRLHDVLASPGFHLLLCGGHDAGLPASGGHDAGLPASGSPDAGFGASGAGDWEWRYRRWLTVHRIADRSGPGVLGDPGRRLVRPGGVQYLVRPDGYVAYRAVGYDVGRLVDLLARWLPATSPAQTAPTPGRTSATDGPATDGY